VCAARCAAGADTLTFLAVQHLGIRYLELLIAILIGAMSVCFSLNWAKTGTNTSELLYGCPPLHPAVAQPLHPAQAQDQPLP
jgi:hypothetical protein